MKIKGSLIAIIIAAIVVVYNSAYVIDETEQVVVTQFGRVIGQARQAPGLFFKIPFIQTANYFPKNLLEWDGEPGQIPTLDKTFIWVDPFARWRIVDPVSFFQTINNTTAAMSRLDDIIDPAVRNYVTSYSLIETVRNTGRKLDTSEMGVDKDQTHFDQPIKIAMGRSEITKGLRMQAQPKIEKFGIELVDVKIKRINYVEEVRDSVYGRMIAERKQIAEKFRSEGKGEAQSILGNKEKDLKQIISEAYKQAQEIKGKADAEATTIFANAYGKDPDFFSFSKTLELYTDSLQNNSSLILSTDSDFLKYLKNYNSSENK
jgi:modulator of FtsH protease HflC